MKPCEYLCTYVASIVVDDAGNEVPRQNVLLRQNESVLEKRLRGLTYGVLLVGQEAEKNEILAVQQAELFVGGQLYDDVGADVSHVDVVVVYEAEHVRQDRVEMMQVAANLLTSLVKP